MIQAVSTYIKSIVIFLVFITYAELIIPDKKYKEYINLVLGLMLVFMLLNPMSKLLHKASNPLGVSKYSNALNSNIIRNERQIYEEAGQKVIIDTYKDGLKKQLAEILSAYGAVTLLDIGVSESEENFGSITSIYAEIDFNPEDKDKKESFIRIEPVRIKRNAMNGTDDIYDDRIKAIKNKISDFYNLSVSNIHIKKR